MLPIPTFLSNQTSHKNVCPIWTHKMGRRNLLVIWQGTFCKKNKTTGRKTGTIEPFFLDTHRLGPHGNFEFEEESLLQ